MIHDKHIYNIYIYMDSMLDVCYSIYVLGSALSASASATAQLMYIHNKLWQIIVELNEQTKQ